MLAKKQIRKAVFPVAGLGTRFLPATKVIPKEMLPIIDRPLIQYAVDEAREAGIEQFIFITGRGKTAIVEHFDTAFELEATMNTRKKALDILESTRIKPGNLITVRQQKPLGLGHAIWCAREIIGNEPFAVFLPDELMIGSPGCMTQMVDTYSKVGGNLVSTVAVPEQDVSNYGVVDPGKSHDELTEIRALIEKPAREDAPSNLIIAGRYILQPEILQLLENQEKGADGEIQLTDAMKQMIGEQPFHALNFSGQRYDCGSKAGFVAATLSLALEQEDLASEVVALMHRVLQQEFLRVFGERMEESVKSGGVTTH